MSLLRRQTRPAALSIYMEPQSWRRTQAIRIRKHGTPFGTVRYGNVMGARGSVIPFFKSIRNGGELPIYRRAHDALHDFS